MSLLLEALKKAEKSKQANAARQDARISPGGHAPEKVREPSTVAEPQETFDLNELTLAPPQESAAPGEESGATAFPEISLLEAEPVEPAGAALEIPAWEPPAPEAPIQTPAAEAALPPPESPAVALSMELPEIPAGKAEPLLTLDFPQAEALPEQKPERKENLEAVQPPFLAPLEPVPIEPIAPQPGEIQTDREPHHIPVGGGLPPSFSVTETQGSGPRPLLQGSGADGTGAATPSQPLTPGPVAARPAAANAAASGAEAAKNILAASRGKPVSNPKLLGAILLVSILAGAAGYYYYQQTLAQPSIGLQLPPPVEQAPLAPPAETPGSGSFALK